MQIGAALAIPWLSDLEGCRDAIVEFDRAGLDHVTIPQNLVSGRPGRYPDMPTFVYASVFRDPFVLFASVAAIATRIRFRTAITVVPLWPTVLLARQAADLAILTGDRFELGVGIGWGEAEYRSLGQELRETGARMEEQVEVLRLLWTQPTITYAGRFHEIDDLGLGEGGLPSKSIPIWFGCSSKERPLRRTARLGDGWLPFPPATRAEVETLHAYMDDAGRAAGSVAIEARIVSGDDVTEQAELQRSIGATQLTIAAASQTSPDTPELGLQEGVEAIVEAAAALRRAAPG